MGSLGSNWKCFVHVGLVYDINDANIDCPTNGVWTSSNESNRFTYNSGSDTYTKTITPSFYNRSNIGRIGFLIKAKDGTGDKKSQIFSLKLAFSSNAKQSENGATI
jgi:hypothetical protein